jgi:hypothetical protein
VTINIACHEAIEIIPFPILPGVAAMFFVRHSRPFADAPQFLLGGDLVGRLGEFVIESEVIESIGRSLFALFGFTKLEWLERAPGNQDLIDRWIGLSTKSRVLCNPNAFVEFSEQVYQTMQDTGDSDSDSNDDEPRLWARMRRHRGLKECSAPRDSSNVDEPRVKDKRANTGQMVNSLASVCPEFGRRK